MRWNIWKDDTGAAAIEFALITALFFVVALAALDFGSIYVEQQQLDKAMSETTVSAYAQADAVPFSSIPTFVRNAVSQSAATVTATCNGGLTTCGNTSRSCACLSSSGSYAAAACGTACTGTSYSKGALAGYYLTVAAHYQYQPVVVPETFLGNTQVSSSATVRLQ